MSNLSDRDRQILKYLLKYEVESDLAPAPSYREIVTACRLSSTALVKESLRRLQAAGLIEWYPGIARSIRVLAATQPSTAGDTTDQSAVISRDRQSQGWA